VLHGQFDVCVGDATFTVIRLLQKSRHSYFLHFAEQRRAVVKEVSLCLYRISRPHLPSTNHINAEPSTFFTTFWIEQMLWLNSNVLVDKIPVFMGKGLKGVFKKNDIVHLNGRVMYFMELS
jgi:hypothetical protein